ncbi:long-chain fatty acid--CoA ligase [Aeromicrobium panaciterrae]|uniref:long-chain-fatty-acid--CoA ligase n=1 Tax=Aeromicrobium panaciterrae TaxID=363861 RepID=UPI0031D28FEA
MTSLVKILEESVEAHPDRLAVIDDGRTLTYRELDARAREVAQVLRSTGVVEGDRVAFSCPNVAEFPIVYFGILMVGAAVVPLNVLLRDHEITYHLDDSSTKVYIAHVGTPALPIGEVAAAGFAASASCEHFFTVGGQEDSSTSRSSLENAMKQVDGLTHSVPVDDDAVAVVLYTSGTTGRPKGAELRHSNMRANVASVCEVFDCNTARPDVYLAALPLYHCYGQTVVQNGALSFGGTIVMLPRFDAEEALRLMEQHAVTFFSGVPTMYWSLLEAAGQDRDVTRVARSLRVANCGGAALPVEMHRRFLDRFGVTILEGYGLSETSPVASFNRLGDEPRVGSIGIPIPGVDMKLVNDDWSEVPDDPEVIGEIAIRGPNVMKGYLGRPEATDEAIRDGWFRSGDLARKDEDGFYYIVDRSKDLIIRGGYNVYPREIEEVLMEHPAVSLVAVIGYPHEALGEEVAAVVVKVDGFAISEDELIAWAKQRLAAYKYPRIVRFVDDMPLTSTGKILKRELKQTSFVTS